MVPRSLSTVFLALSLVCGLAPRSNGAQPRVSTGEIARNSDLVFVGTVVEQSTRLNAAQTMTFTDVVFGDVVVVRAGSGSQQSGAPEIRLTHAGGRHGDIGFTISEAPTFETGMRYLLFTRDDGKIYANPLVGGAQGQFRVLVDEVTGDEYVLTAGGRAVLGLDENGMPIAGRQVESISAGRPIEPPRTESIAVQSGPSASEEGQSAVPTSREESDSSLPLRLEAFLPLVTKDTSSSTDGREDVLRLRETDTSYDGGGKSQALLHTLPSDVPTEGETPQSEVEAALPHPVPSASVRPGVGSLGSTDEHVLGAALSYCGFQDLNIVMEQVPSSWWSYSENNNAMWLWNQTMDLYRYTADDGSWGDNGENEFGGFPSDASLYSTWGFHWNGALAMCITQTYCNCCEIIESDIVFNPAYSWTTNAEGAINNGSVVLYMPVAVHELGHSWGAQRGAETYDYDELSVMHAYYSNIVESGWGIHAGDAYLVRRDYDDQTSILGTRDIGVESYYASNGLVEGTLSSYNVVAGTPVTFRGVTVENTSYSALSNVRIRFYLSTNRTITTSDYQVGGYWYWTSFSREARNVSNYTVTIPTTIPPGTYYAGIRMTIDGDGNDDFTSNNTTTFADRVTIVAPPTLAVSPASVDLGTHPAGTTFTTYLTATNTGGGLLNCTATESASWITYLSPTSFSLTAGQSRTITVRGAFPTTAGPFGSNVTVSSNGGSKAIRLSGTTSVETITVTLPTSGSIWPATTTQRIAWSSVGASSLVDIYLSRDGGSTYTLLFNDTPNDGLQYWTVTGPASTNCRIRITDSDGHPTDDSSGTFTISPDEPAMSVFSLPTGSGERLDDCQHGDGSIMVSTGIPGLARADVWLESTMGGLSACTGGTVSDAGTDGAGVATFTGPVSAGGWTDIDHGERVIVMVLGIPRYDHVHNLQFNSPDINGDRVVDLRDVGDFATDFAGVYRYRSDFVWDGVINLADVGRMAMGIGASCGAQTVPARAKPRDATRLSMAFEPKPGDPDGWTVARLLARGEPLREGLRAWQLRVTGSPNAEIRAWSLPEKAVNLTGAPDFIVGCGAPPTEDATTEQALVSFEFRSGDGMPVQFRLEPVREGRGPGSMPMAAVGTEESRLIDLIVPDGGVIAYDPADPTGSVPSVLPLDLTNVPNPFNPSTQFTFNLPRGGRVEIHIFGANGRRVSTLDAGVLAAGPQVVPWRGTSTDGRDVASGVYYYELRLDGVQLGPTSKMVLLK